MRNFHRNKPVNISKLNKADRRILNLYSELPVENVKKNDKSEALSQLRDESFKP